MSNEENDSSPEEEDYYPNEEDPNKIVRIKKNKNKKILFINKIVE